MENNDQNSIKALCSNCNHQTCCTGFDSPVVFPEDLINLAQIQKTSEEYFEEVIIAGMKVKLIRKNSSNHCIFWNNKCEIYDFRPLDCRLFPFDIDMIDNEFYWILYSCNKDSDWKWTEEYLQQLECNPILNERFDYLNILNNSPYSEPEKMPFVVLRKVKFR